MQASPSYPWSHTSWLRNVEFHLWWKMPSTPCLPPGLGLGRAGSTELDKAAGSSRVGWLAGAAGGTHQAAASPSGAFSLLRAPYPLTYTRFTAGFLCEHVESPMGKRGNHGRSDLRHSLSQFSQENRSTTTSRKWRSEGAIQPNPELTPLRDGHTSVRTAGLFPSQSTHIRAICIVSPSAANLHGSLRSYSWQVPKYFSRVTLVVAS